MLRKSKGFRGTPTGSKLRPSMKGPKDCLMLRKLLRINSSLEGRSFLLEEPLGFRHCTRKSMKSGKPGLERKDFLSIRTESETK